MHVKVLSKEKSYVYTILWLLCWRFSKESTGNAGDISIMGLVPESERSPKEGNGTLLQHSCLGNPMDRGAQPHYTVVYKCIIALCIKNNVHTLIKTTLLLKSVSHHLTTQGCHKSAICKKHSKVKGSKMWHACIFVYLICVYIHYLFTKHTDLCDHWYTFVQHLPWARGQICFHCLVLDYVMVIAWKKVTPTIWLFLILVPLKWCRLCDYCHIHKN